MEKKASVKESERDVQRVEKLHRILILTVMDTHKRVTRAKKKKESKKI